MELFMNKNILYPLASVAVLTGCFTAANLAHAGSPVRVDRALMAKQPTGNLVLYTAKWCFYCQESITYLKAKGYAYQNIDIDTEEGNKAFSQFPGYGVPLLVAGKRRVEGFSNQGYDKLLASSTTMSSFH
jgi:glutaredoxin